MIPRLHALYLAKLKILPFIQKARFVLPLRLYLPFSGWRVPRCANTRREGPWSAANWTMRAFTRCAMCSSALRILRQRSALSCSFSAMMPVSRRLRAIGPNRCFLKAAISLAPPINRVARMVPSTVWTVHTANCSLRLRSIAQSFVSAVVICAAILGGLLNVFSMGVCNHHCFPRRTRAGLPISKPSGRSRPNVRTLTQDQQVPVQTLSRMDEPLLSFHRPAYKETDLFHDRGGTGGRSEKGFFFSPVRGILASFFSLRVRHFLSEVEQARADPIAASI